MDKTKEKLEKVSEKTKETWIDVKKNTVEGATWLGSHTVDLYNETKEGAARNVEKVRTMAGLSKENQ